MTNRGPKRTVNKQAQSEQAPSPNAQGQDALGSSLQAMMQSLQTQNDMMARMMNLQMELQTRVESLESAKAQPAAVAIESEVQARIAPPADKSIRKELTDSRADTIARLNAQPKRRLIVEEPWETIIDTVRVPFPKGVWMAPLEVADMYDEWRMRQYEVQALESKLANAGGGMIPYNQLNSLLGSGGMGQDDWEGSE